MNKKRLSVVMAGAMLATSVAPVMAADATETKTLSESQLAAYANTIKAKMDENTIDATKNLKIYGADNSSNGTATDFVTQAVSKKANEFKAGESTYGVKINGGAVEYTISDAISAIKAAKAGTKIEIVKYKTSSFHGLLIPGSDITTLGTENSDKYVAADFNANFSSLESELTSNDYVKGYELSDDKTTLTITLHALDADGKNKTVTAKVGEAKLDLDIPMSGDNILSQTAVDDDIQKCDGFMRVQNWVPSQLNVNPEEVVETVTVAADADPTKETLKVSDLYDGTILTSKGTEILNDLKNDSALDLVKLKESDVVSDKGVNSFTVEYYAKGDKSKAIKSITISSTNKEETVALFNILENESYSVGVVGGANRYATAVSVAKQQGVSLAVGTTDNIVLVNGSSLVDGLSAAPLAASINGANAAAPVLLSKSDYLPEETKTYLKELLSNLTAAQAKDITVTLVGGESVLSSSVVNELKEMGFKVDRLGGANREETSLEVAREIGNTTTAFVVGAEGEADAMSISSVAANNKTPIIVSKIGGLSDAALRFLEKQSGDAVIIGGTSVVSKEEEEKINEAKSDSKTAEAVRIAGTNRQATNAKIIEKYYGTAGSLGLANGVLLAKDGSNNKAELVDALTAANLKAPIVLVGNKVTTEQNSAILNAKKVVTTGSTAKALQIGEGLDTNILKAVAKTLGLKNKDTK